MNITHRPTGDLLHSLLHRAGLAVALVALLLTSLLAPAFASSAQAAVTSYSTTTSWIGGGSVVNVRTAADRASRLAYSLRVGASLSIDCQLVGGRLGFSQYAQNRTWNRLSDGRFVHDAVTTTPGGPRTALPDGGYVAWSPQIPRCADQQPAAQPQAPTSTVQPREARAVEFARGQLGVSSTAMTNDGMWSGWCETFVEAAFGTRYRYRSAITDFATQRDAGRIHTDPNPPAGALVFYEWGQYGHVGISLGDGQAISTQGYDVALPVRQHSVAGLGLHYLGWSLAPDSWTGR